MGAIVARNGALDFGRRGLADVFISYSKRPEYAERLAAIIAAYGYDVFWDRHLAVGGPYPKNLENELRAAKAVVVLWCEHSVASQWVYEEATLAKDANKLLPATLSNIEIPMGLKIQQAARLNGWSGSLEHTGLQVLLEGIETKVGKRPRKLPDLLRHLQTAAPLPAIVQQAAALQIISSGRDREQTNTDNRLPYCAVVFDEAAATQLSRIALGEDWSVHFRLPAEARGLKRVVVDDVCFFLSNKVEEIPERVISFDLRKETGFYEARSFLENIFDRCWTVAAAVWAKRKAIPPKWQPYRDPRSSRISLFAASKRIGDWARVFLRQDAQIKGWIHVYNISDEVDFSKVPEDLTFLSHIQSALVAAAVAPGERNSESMSSGHLFLDSRLSSSFDPTLTVEDWYRSKLSPTQRRFVDRDYDGPARLRGAAGTGKTLALVVKCVRDALHRFREQKPWRVAYITHSQSTREQVEAMLDVLDKECLSTGYAPNVSIDVFTIYELAVGLVQVNDNRAPLSTDGVTGRQQQRDLIRTVLNMALGSEQFHGYLARASAGLRNSIESVDDDPESELVYEIAREFACKLDGESVKFGHEESVDRYLSEKRARWLMELDSRADRVVMLELYRRYCELLKERKILSVDQLVVDLYKVLDTYAWLQSLDERGYDALFVDEIHMFSPVEKMTLQRLIRPNKEIGRDGLPVFFAYDLRQANTSKYILGPDGSSMFAGAKLSKAARFELRDAFRYTPEIANVLKSIDDNFPLLELGEEWTSFSAVSRLDSGSLPTYSEHYSFEEMARTIFEAAVHRSKTLSGRQVAVLFQSDALLTQALLLAEAYFSRKFVAADERVESAFLRRMGKRFLIGTPEFVQGLQFETVYLCGINQDSYDMIASTIRRSDYLSSAYLGASRAERRLHVAADRSRGGIAEVFRKPIEAGLLTPISDSDLRSGI